ncbi:MAG: Transcriptional regulator, partial [Myxococcaceae bacterium]|nr:Transcriptional regulator [Myxococcaceae bacterium]
TAGDEVGAAEMNRRVSDVLKRIRKSRELSLDQLATRSGVSRAALSQIEGARTNPTLSVLWKIAVGLEIPFQELLELPDDSNAKVLRAGDAVVLRSADGRVESRLISPGGSAPGIEMYELKLAPKGLLRSEPHGKGTTETVYLLKGALRINVAGTEYDLMAGDSIFFKADCPHEYENRGSHEARVLDLIFYDKRQG